MNIKSIILITVLGVACGGDGSTSPDDQSGGSADTNLSATWTGSVGQAGQTPTTSLSWVSTHSGASLSGPVTVTTTDGGQTHTVSGTLAGTISGAGIALSLSFSAGAFTSLGAPSSCSMSGSGNATLATANGVTTITGPLNIVWTASCVGTVSDHTTETQQLILTKH